LRIRSVFRAKAEHGVCGRFCIAFFQNGRFAERNFSLQIGIDPSVKSTVKQLRELGADGLAARFEFLQKQGLPL